MNPQTPAQQPFYGRKISKKGVNVTQATDKQLILKEDYDAGNTLYYDINGNPSVLLGTRQANSVNGIGKSQQGFFVSQSGINVTSATDSQLIFNSGNDVFKIVKTFTMSLKVVVTVTNNVAYNVTTLPHGLTYSPAYLAYITLDPVVAADGANTNGQIITPAMVFGTLGSNVSLFSMSTVSVNGTTIFFDTQLGGFYPAATYNFSAKVYLLQETFS